MPPVLIVANETEMYSPSVNLPVCFYIPTSPHTLCCVQSWHTLTTYLLDPEYGLEW